MAEADRIDIVFGAQIAGLVAGVKEAEAAIKGLVAPIEEIKNATSGMFEAIGAAFVVDKIREFATEMGELGEKTLNMAYVMGQSVGDIAQFQSMMRLAGGDADEAGQSLVRFARFVQQVQEGNNRAVTTLHNLGITEAEVKQHGDNLLETFQLFIRRISELDPSFRNLSAESQVFARGVLRLAGIMREGGEGWDELVKNAQAFREAMEANAAGMADTEKKANVLKDAIEVLKVDGFGLLKPAIDASYGAMTEFVTQLNAAITPLNDAKNKIDDLGMVLRNLIQGFKDVGSLFIIIADGFRSLTIETTVFGQVIVEVVTGAFNIIKAKILGGDVDAAVQTMMNNIKGIVGAGLDGVVANFKDAWAQIQAIVAGLSAPLGADPNVVGLPDVSVTGRRGGRRLGTEAPGGRGRDTTKQEYEAFAAEMRLEIAEADKDWAQISAIYDKWAEHAKELFGANSKEYREVLLDMTRAHQQHIQQIFQQEEQAYSTTRSIDESYFKSFESNLEEMVKKHHITKQQMYGFDLQYATQQHELQRKMLEEMIQNDQFTHDDKVKLYNQLLEEDARYAARSAEIQQKATPKTGFVDIFGGIPGAISDVASGRERIGQAFAKLGEGILQKVMDNVIEKLIVQNLANLLEQLVADAGNTSILATLLTLILAKPSVLGTSFAGGGIVPSAAGGWVVPSFQGGGIVAQLHSNEMVLPSHISQGLQDMMASGGANPVSVNFNVSSMDSQDVGRFFRANGHALVSGINSALRNGSTLRTA